MSEDIREKENLVLETCKQLRKETGISIGICNEASKESNGNLEQARIILREKCIQAGEKYYKNAEKLLLYFGIVYKETASELKIVKIGCQSDFLIAGDTIGEIADSFLKMKNFGNFTEENWSFIENELKFHSGVVKENIQLLEAALIPKTPEEKFYIIKHATPSNPGLYGSVTVIKYDGTMKENDLPVTEDTKQQISINIHSFMKKSIINVPVSEEKPVKYTHILQEQALKDFLASPLLTDRSKTLEKFFQDRNIDIKILSIFCI